MRKSAIALAVIAVLAINAGPAMAGHGSRYGGHGRDGPAYSARGHHQQGYHGRYHHGGARVYRSYGYPSAHHGYGYPSVYRSYHRYSPPSGFYYRGPGFGISIGF